MKRRPALFLAVLLLLVPVSLGIGVAYAQDINLLAGPSILAVGQQHQSSSASVRRAKTSTLA